MFATTLRRFASAADLLRPRTLFRTLARVDRLADVTRELEATVRALTIRTEQLEAIARLDWELRDDIQGLPSTLDSTRIRSHVECAVAAAPLCPDPFPHVVIENWLPAEMYELMIRALPPPVFFADRDEARQRLTVPFSVAPLFSRRVWQYVADQIVGDMLRQALKRKFEPAIRAYLHTFCGAVADTLDFEFHPSDGRIMLRRPGYVITPHRDPKWGFVTGLVYLARPGDNETYGTQLYRVLDDREAPNDKPYYVDSSRCELVRAVPFRPNTLLAFLNSAGAHGASIPADAQPPSLERYVYQFRLGPDHSGIKRLLAMMPADRREAWSGAKARRAASY